MNDISFTEIRHIFKRSRSLFYMLTSTFFLLFVIGAFTWSNYRAEASIEIAQGTINTGSEYPATNNTPADLRINRLQQKVLSIDSLSDIIRLYHLYPDQQPHRSLVSLAKKMQQHVRISLIGNKLASPASTQKAAARQLSAIAFTISFDYHDPELAQQVTNALATQFLETDQEDQQTQSFQTAAFLESQLKTLETKLAAQEKEIATFRMKHGDSSQETLKFNKQTAATLATQIQSMESRIAEIRAKQEVLRTQLAATPPYSRTLTDDDMATTPALHLKALEREYQVLRAKYAAQHPDIIKLRRQIATLRPIASNDLNTIQEDADNPTYLSLVTQIRALEEQYNALLKQQKTLEKDQRNYQRSIKNSPLVEKEFAALSRNYSNMKAQYKNLKDEKLQADMNKDITQKQESDHLILASPAERPTQTTPSRLVFLAAGCLFSLALSLLCILSIALFKGRLMGKAHLIRLTGKEPLISVPSIDNKRG
ncbi:MAG: GumC family protein [Bdellovibrionales bacterium]